MNLVDTTVADSTDETSVYGWDWSATTHEGYAGIVDDFLGSLGAEIWLPGRGLQGWSESVQAFDGDGYELASIYFNGGREDVHVLATSSAAHQARSRVLTANRGKTARVDTRVDTLVPFDELAHRCHMAAASYNTRLTRIESWDGQGESLGRTVYLGAPSSAIRVRIYEKWLESPGQYVEGTNRVEVQLRPPSKAKERVSGWSPAETFCASRVTRDIAKVLGTDATEVGTLHVKRETPTLERSLEAMGEQYGKSVARFLERKAGDVETVLNYLGITSGD